MFSKSNLLSTLVAAVWSLLGGWLLWGIVADPILAEHLTTEGIMKETPDFMYLTIGCIIQGFILSTIYGRWGNGIYGASTGLKFGFWIGLLGGFGEGFINFATSNMLDLQGTLINAVVYIVFYAIMGLLIGFVYQKTQGVAQSLS